MVPSAAVIPVAFQYAWGERPSPAAWAHLGAPIAAAELDAAGLERAVEDGLARIDDALAGRERPFRTLVAPRVRAPEEGFGARLLGGRKEADG
jgi:hypothetical protein